MSNSVQGRSDSIISTDKFKASATSLQVSDDVTFEEWKDFGSKLARVDGAIQWWIGDWALAGDKVNANTDSKVYDELEDVTGLSRKTVQTCKSVSEAVDSSRRREELSWSHHAEVAPLNPDKQDYWLDRCIELGLSRAKFRRELKAEKYADPELPSDKYRVIYADPPWEYGAEQHSDKTGRGKSASGAQETVLDTHYPQMSMEQLQGMNVESIAQDDAVLFMWATVPLMPGALEVMEAWGFTYKTHMVWDKVRHNVGNYLSIRHELLLIGGRGSSTPDVGKLHDSVYEEERTAHSKKPEYFRELIDTLYPNGKRIELFAREEHDGWDVMGNQV